MSEVTSDDGDKHFVEWNEKFIVVLERVIPRLAAVLADGSINQVDLDDLAFLRDAYERMVRARPVFSLSEEMPAQALRRALLQAAKSTTGEDIITITEAVDMMETAGVDAEALRYGLDQIRQISEQHGMSPAVLMKQFANDYARRLARAGMDPAALQRRLNAMMNTGDKDGMAKLRDEVVARMTAYENKHGRGDPA